MSVNVHVCTHRDHASFERLHVTTVGPQAALSGRSTSGRELESCHIGLSRVELGG